MTTAEGIAAVLLLIGLPLSVAGLFVQGRQFLTAVERQDPRWENRPRLSARSRLVVILGWTCMIPGMVIYLGAR